jgi:magnesium-protoporphyrin IX monomethyl ester (oxidative) cyclase
MQIVLVQPAGSNWVAGRKDVSTVANRMAPTGVLSIAAFLEKEGHDVNIYDCLGPAKLTDPVQVAEHVKDLKPDLVGFSATTSGFLDGYDIASRLKTLQPDIDTIFGGVHVSAWGEQLLEQFENIDYLCLGEGEPTMAELAAGKPLSQIKGLVWRDGDRIVTNPERRQLVDVDTLPFPAYAKLDGFPRYYHLPLFNYIRKPGATMITSRGCPYQCSYCDRSVFRRTYRYNSAEYIYEHMYYLRRRFGVRHINIYDDLFTAHRSRVTRLCDLLIRKPLGIQFNCAVRVGHVDDQLLKMLRAAGALQLSLGIETGDQALMTIHKPGVNLTAVRETVKNIQDHGLRAKGLFMMGLPGDTVQSIRKTTAFALSLGLDEMNMSKFTPFYGAPIWQQVVESGQFDQDWRKMNCLNFVYKPDGIASVAMLDRLYMEHVQQFYSHRDYRLRFIRRLWAHRWSVLHLLLHLPAFLSAKRSFEVAAPTSS